MGNFVVTSNGRETNTLSQSQVNEERRCLRTGITIEPLKVRLVTKQSDVYTWVIRPSDHGMMAYKELCREVGQSFHAVTFAKAATSAEHLSLGLYRVSTYPPASNVPAETGAMTHEDLVAHTTCQLYLTEESLKVETASRECLQKELESLSVEYEHLAQQFRQQTEKASQSESMLYKCLEVINQMASLAEEVQQDYRSTADSSVFPK
ncbi:hypothetical protein BKA56DRAFT_638803 [Ilyonectria sp. MPI-CAGE-AT-0026]|nr:hypothetical protein BKA56DRAFT_638803 [Ilyonectria sp. MPI-CAGE-AT-0026]